MAAELGQFCLILALMIALLQSVLPLYGAARRERAFMAFASHAALAQCLFLGLAFLILVRAFVTSDFSITIVAIHSNTQMPYFFRMAASWGNHEGSLLLWVLILAVFGAGIAVFGTNLPETFKARVLAVQAGISTGFLALTIFTSSPFARLHPIPAEGQELNPLLQDVGLVMHPPFLYLGYVGFSVAFAFAVAALIEGRVDATWARHVRPWVLAAWVFLTIGITLGSFWAYYELGWGGWWFWDPVENASFMPWLVGTALLHSAIVVEKRQTLIVWTLMLAILAFSLSLIGTFVVRSGVLTSVHAFAVDPERGVFILALMVLYTGGALMLFAARAGQIDRLAPFTTVSREGGLILNNILLTTGAATVFLGTFYPLIVEVMGEKISVGPPYYNASFVPLMVPMLIAVAFGPLLRWKRDGLKAVSKRLKLALGAAVLVLLFGIALGGIGHIGAAFGLALGAWLVVGSALVIWRRVVASSRKWEMLRTTPAATWGLVLAHLGLGLFVIGVTTMTAWQEEKVTAMPIGGSIRVGGYDITLTEVVGGAEQNYQYERGTFAVAKDGRDRFTMSSERRFYPVSNRVTTEAAIRPVGLTNIYIGMGERQADGAFVARLYWHPLVLLIWLGPAAMALGGVVSLADRRMRIGAPAPRRRAVTA